MERLLSLSVACLSRSKTIDSNNRTVHPPPPFRPVQPTPAAPAPLRCPYPRRLGLRRQRLLLLGRVHGVFLPPSRAQQTGAAASHALHHSRPHVTDDLGDRGQGQTSCDAAHHAWHGHCAQGYLDGSGMSRYKLRSCECVFLFFFS